MNLFILAAGKGTRLYPLTKDRPKSLITLGDSSTVLERQLDVAIDSAAFNKIYVITGYCSEMIEKKVAEYSQSNIEVIFNPYFDVSNNLFSLWTAHYLLLDEDFIISNGDNVYKKGIYQKIICELLEETIQLTVNKKSCYDEDDMKISLNIDGYVKCVSKKMELDQVNCESLGLALVRGQKHRAIFYRGLMELVRDRSKMNAFWLEIFNKLIQSGETIRICEVLPEDWAEIDFHPDIAMLQRAIAADLF